MCVGRRTGRDKGVSSRRGESRERRTDPDSDLCVSVVNEMFIEISWRIDQRIHLPCVSVSLSESSVQSPSNGKPFFLQEVR